METKKRKPTIDPLMLDDKCPECGNELPTSEEKWLSTKHPEMPALTIYYRLQVDIHGTLTKW